MTVENTAKQRQLSGLKMWQPGQSGNPKGRRPAGLSVLEWMNQMADWPLNKIKAVGKDKKTPAAQVMAVARILSSVRETALGGADFDRVMDRTIGKPAQQILLTGQVDNIHYLETSRLQAMLVEVERLIVQLGGPGALEALDVDAEPAALMLDSEDVSAGATGDQPAKGRQTDDLESKIS